MSKEFTTNYREERMLSKLDSSKDVLRDRQLQDVRKNHEELSDRLAQKLIDEEYVVTSNRRELVRQLSICCEEMVKSEDFEINYRISPFRTLVANPIFISLYITAFVVETLINHPDVEDIYGTDEEIYRAVNQVVTKFIRLS